MKRGMTEKQVERCNPYFLYEKNMELIDRGHKRLWVVILVLIALLCISNVGWLYINSQYEKVVVTQENADGYNNYIGNDGDISN